MFQDYMAVFDCVILRGKCVVMSESLQKQALEQVHVKPYGNQKTKLLAHE